MKQPRVLEKHAQQQIVTLLRSIGGAVYVLGTRRPSGDFQGTRQSPGIPDVFAILPAPRLPGPTPAGALGLWIEVKAAGGRLRPEQREFQDLCLRANLAHVSGGVDEVMAFLIRGGWLKSENVPHYRLAKGPIHG